MHLLLTGGTGLIGRALCRHWHVQGHKLTVLSRRPNEVAQLCSGARGIASLDALQDGAPPDAIVNLAGAPIADRRWSKRRRELLWHSRVTLTRSLVEWIAQQSAKPHTLISGSATGWYGDGGDHVLDESSPAMGNDFGSRLCAAWEQEAQRAQPLGVRVVLLRTAPVLSAHGGMLARMLPIFRMGLGGRIGSGRQWMPWIHIADEVALIDHLLKNDQCAGVYNACAPQPVRNVEFTKVLAQTLKRPACISMPAALLRLALGDMSVLLLGGQRLAPNRTLDSGYVFRYPKLDQALQAVIAEYAAKTR